MTVHPHCPTLFDALELLDYLARTGGTAFVNTLDARLPGLTVFVPTRLTYPGPADTYVATLLAADPALRPRLASGTPACVSLMGDYFPNLAAAVGLHFDYPRRR